MTLEHVGIAIDDPEAAKTLFEKLLGCTAYKEEAVFREGVRTHFLPAGAAKLELLEALGPDTAVARFLKKRGEGLHHLAFEVDDVHTHFQRVQEQGFSPLSQAPRPGADGKLIFFLHPRDTHGLLVEFCQQMRSALPLTHVPCEGAKVAAYELGTRRRPTVVVLHSLHGSTSLETAPLARRLQPHYHVLALDFSGHGASESPPSGQSLSFGLFSENVAAVLDHFDVSQTHLFGFSLGGAVALDFARTRPNRVNRLAVHAANAHWNDDPALAAQARFDYDLLESITAPTLVTGCDQDDFCSVDSVLRLYRRLPRGRLALFPGSHHALSELDLAAYLPLLASWWGHA